MVRFKDSHYGAEGATVIPLSDIPELLDDSAGPRIDLREQLPCSSGDMWWPVTMLHFGMHVAPEFKVPAHLSEQENVYLVSKDKRKLMGTTYTGVWVCSIYQWIDDQIWATPARLAHWISPPDVSRNVQSL